MLKNFKNSEKGAGLIEVLIASGIMLVVIKFLMQSFLNFKNYQKYEEMQLDKLFLKNYINEAVDCQKTLDGIGSSCPKGKLIELAGKDGDVLIALKGKGKKKGKGKNKDKDKGKETNSEYTKIGSYQVRAVCGSDDDIVIQSRLVNKDDKPLQHPTRKKLKGEALWISMHRNIGFKCEIE